MTVDQLQIRSRKMGLLPKINTLLQLILPCIAAILFVSVFLAVTDRYGLGVSTDSVQYIGAAEKILSEGKLQISVTTWDSETQYAPLSHFPPLLPLVLAFLSWSLNIDPVSACRWLNALCIATISFTLLLPVAKSYVSLFVMIAVLTGGPILYVHLWAWSEPLFLLLVVVSSGVGIRLLMRVDSRNWHLLAVLAVVSGLATLTRYAGMYLAIGFIGLFVLRRAPIQVKTRQIAFYVSIYLATISPWFIWLSTVGTPARELGFYKEGIGAEVTHHLILTVVHWLIPYSLPRSAKMVVLVAGAVIILAWIVLQYHQQVDRSNAVPVYVSSVLFVTYLAFIIFARLFADPGIPFDNRILSPALIHIALSLGYIAGSLIKARVYVVTAVLLLAFAIASSVYSTVPLLDYVARHGNEFSSEFWRKSETIAWLQNLPPEVLIFSNGADAICANLPVSAKYTPSISELSRISEFEQRVKQNSPAVIVLFNDMHSQWLLGQEQIAHLEDGNRRRIFSDSIVYSWGLESSVDK